MCQIQFILNKNKKKLDSKDERELEKLMCFGDRRNHHAFGFITKDDTYKEAKRFVPHKIKKAKIKRSNFVVGHNRYATGFIANNAEQIKRGWFDKITDFLLPECSFIQDYQQEDSKIKDIQSHPFELGDFILVHNGVIYNDCLIRERYKINSSIKTDSFSIIYLIDKFFKESKKKKRIQKITEAIQKTSRELRGWYSCFLYDKKGNNLIYFKSGAKFCMKEVGDKIIGSTDWKNLRYVYSEEKKYPIPLHDSLIYLIKDSGEIKIIDSFKTQEDISLCETFKEDMKMIGSDLLSVFKLIINPFNLKLLKGGGK